MTLSVHRVLIGLSIFPLIYREVVMAATLHKPEIVEFEDTCGEHQTFTWCQANPTCEKSCDNIDIWESAPCVRKKKCISGCICEEGYVRDNQLGICVWENSCPRVRH
ncbi:serine protease inhibitor [Andrena cerasifolii]|uniref:serine protease inhibitor n=1 Tax=Andrena cerasifolii TaxID=2819439 RepID=UPI0040377021